MTTVDLNNIELNEFQASKDPRQHCRATFPLTGIHGSQQLATVYIELEPGDNLGMHTDSAEELLIVLEGEVEATVGNEKNSLQKKGMALVPQMIPHDVKNIGTAKARILGVFGGANNIVATFENEWQPANSRVVDTSLLGN